MKNFESTWIPSGMTCGPTSHDGFRGLVALAAVGQLPADEALHLEAHLQDCEDCRTDLLQLKEVTLMLSRAFADANGAARSGNSLRPRIAEKRRCYLNPNERFSRG